MQRNSMQAGTWQLFSLAYKRFVLYQQKDKGTLAVGPVCGQQQENKRLPPPLHVIAHAALLGRKMLACMLLAI